MKDPWDDPRAQEWLRHCQSELLPMITESALTIAIVPDEPDAKAAVELGYSILLNKPIVLFAPKGRRIPDKLLQVADEIVTGSPSDPDVQRKFREALERLGVE